MMFYRFSGKQILRHKVAFRKCTREGLSTTQEERKEGRKEGRKEVWAGGGDEMQGGLNKDSS